MGYIFNKGTADEVTITQIVCFDACEQSTPGDYSHGSVDFGCFNLFEAPVYKDLKPYYDAAIAAGTSLNFYPLFKQSDAASYQGVGVYITNNHATVYVGSQNDYSRMDNIVYDFEVANAPSSLPAAFTYFTPDPISMPASVDKIYIRVYPKQVKKAHITQHVLPNAYGGNLGLWFYQNPVNRVDLDTFPVIYYAYELVSFRELYRSPAWFSEIPEYVPYYATSSSPSGNSMSKFAADLVGNDGVTPPEHEEPEPPEEDPFDPAQPEPYAPNIDDTSDDIGLPPVPDVGVTTAGFINVYKVTLNALMGLGDILFPNVASATDIVDAVYKLCQTLANQNLINYVIDCHVLPVTPTTGSNANIKVGYRDTGISAAKVTSDYVDVSCGTLNIQEYFGGFADYLATKSKIYLPFVGFVDTKPEYWQSGVIGVDYRFNIIDGSFMVYIRSTSSKSQLSGTVIAQYAGNACMHFPLTGVNYSNMVSGIVGAVIAPATKGAISPGLEKALSATNTLAQGGDVQQSNGYNSTAALLGVRKPYLVIERAVPAYAGNYRHDKGYPSNITAVLSSVTGFTTISDIDLSGIPFTSGELDELRQLLSDGVYF